MAIARAAAYEVQGGAAAHKLEQDPQVAAAQVRAEVLDDVLAVAVRVERELPLDLAELVVDGVDVDHLERHELLGLLVATAACVRPQRNRRASVSGRGVGPTMRGGARTHHL